MDLQAFLSRQTVTPEGILPRAILVEEEKIQAVVPVNQVPSHAQILDFDEAAILPGLIDPHVHINDPGRDWEGFESATRAAAAGAYTLLVDMPLNCVPGTTSVEALEAKREAARGHCHIDWAAWGGVVRGNQQNIEPLAAGGVRGYKCFLIDPGIDSFTMVAESELREALPHVARTGLPLLVHAELSGPVDAATAALAEADWRSYATYLKSRPDAAEVLAIRLIITLCREYSFRAHIVHLSTCQALAQLRAARVEGLRISVETCPHYLHLAAETIADRSTLHKCSPPIRNCENREQLWQGLKDGVIDLIGTDHSPCPPAMKRLEEGNFKTAWGGISSLSLCRPLMWTEASRRGFSLYHIRQWRWAGPAGRRGFSSRKGRIAAGYDADPVIFNAAAEFVGTTDPLHSPPPVSPYLGAKLRGIVKATYLRGRMVFADGKFSGEGLGREYGRE